MASRHGRSLVSLKNVLSSAPVFSVLAICPIAILTWALFFYGDRNHSSAAACDGRLRNHGFVGNPDLYGLGIRLGIYLQWITFLIAEAALLKDTSDITGAYAAFSVALLVAMLILIFEDGCVFTIEICILLTVLFGGFWCVLGRKKSTDADSAPPPPWIDALGLDIIPVVIGVLALVVGTWYWMRMAILGDVDFTPTPSGTSFFVFARVTNDHLQQGSAFMAFFCIWIASTPVFELVTSRWSRDDQHGPLEFLRWVLLLDLARASENIRKLCRIILLCFQVPENSASKIAHRVLSALYFCISIWFILAIELELKWNKVEGVNEIKTTGQIIPFVIGVLSISQLLFKLLRSSSEAKTNRHGRGRIGPA